MYRLDKTLYTWFEFIRILNESCSRNFNDENNAHAGTGRANINSIDTQSMEFDMFFFCFLLAIILLREGSQDGIEQRSSIKLPSAKASIGSVVPAY